MASPASSPEATPVCIVVGAGPGGLCTAAYQARRGYQVHVFDRRPSPLAANASDDTRAFVMALNARGRTALEGAGLDLAATATDSSSGLHTVSSMAVARGSSAPRVLPMAKPRVVGPRHAFVAAMMAQLQAQELPNLHFSWETSFEGLDLQARTASFRPCDSDGSSDGDAPLLTLRYDLLVAADGGWSRVRKAAAAQAPELSASVTASQAAYKVAQRLPGPLPAGDAGSQLTMLVGTGSGHPCVLFTTLDPAGDGTCCAMVSIAAQHGWDGLDTPDALAAFLAARFPALPPAWEPLLAEQMSGKPAAVAGMRVRCSQLHAPGGLVLIGDAGHGVSPRTGNGMNSALEDAALLDRLLTDNGGDLEALPAAFTAARQADAEALLWLDGTAPARNGTAAAGRLHPAAVASTAAMLGRLLLRKVAPTGWVDPPAMMIMNESCAPYSAVKRQIQRDALLAGTLGLPLTAPLALLTAAQAAVGA